jgi:preprotein translocase subunit SecD
MTERNFRFLALVILLAVAAGWVVWPQNPGIHIELGPIKIHQDIQVHEGLDLRGGLQVLLEADLPPGQELPRGALADTRVIVENRINALGVTEPLIQLQGDRRVVVELPGIKDPDLAVKTFGETGLLEFIDVGYTPLRDGDVVKTTVATGSEGKAITPTTSISGTVTPTSPITGTEAVTATEGVTASAATQPESIYTTVIQGKDLQSATPGRDTTGKPMVNFTLKPDGAKVFAEFTRAHNEEVLQRPYYLCIVLDKVIISCPSVRTAITEGKGVITMGGNATDDEARGLAIQLRYGALPVPLKPVEIRTVGPTLGEDSVRKSITAGIIGMLIVVSFMLTYYRLPGVLADAALLIYATVVFALFKLIPVTLTLPGIAGFVLSVGMAVDANILIFERMKEELRAGRLLHAAVDAGFSRAWPSIRDSNFSTLITCTILFWFGANFGATIVKGFALTLAIGVLVSMFTAIMVTRTFLRLIMDMDVTRNHWWFGV